MCRLMSTGLICAAAMLLAAESAPARPSSAASQPASEMKSGINFDALTVDDCRRRLALPKSQRPVDPDPRVDLDGVCKNILAGMNTKASSKAPASSAHAAPSSR